MLTATQLAAELGYSKGRISQLASEGCLAGCFTGDGRARRFDPAKVRAALNIRLDPGQQTGNGLPHLARRVETQAADLPTALDESDARRLARARADAAEIDARRKRREDAAAAGRYVLTEEHRRVVRALAAQTVAAAERLLIDETRRLAARCGADPAEAVAEIRARWRKLRLAEAEAAAAQAEAAAHSLAETAEMETA